MHRIGYIYDNITLSLLKKIYIKTGNISPACVQFLYVGFHSQLRKKKLGKPKHKQTALKIHDLINS
jgi:hypothetical protein